MQDIVIIPTYDRPEMLWLCLQHLVRCPDLDTMRVWVVVDDHMACPPPRPEIDWVVSRFQTEVPLEVTYRDPHPYAGNSYNLLTAYKEAYDEDAEHIFLVEDDVMIRPEFFAWHRMNLATAACSIGVVKEPQHGPYVSLGVGLHRKTVKAMLPHIHEAYFQNMRGYCKAMFPHSKLDCEQDGLWARVLTGKPVVWATTPLAQHVGWYGYHRKRSVRPHGSLIERYDQVRQALGSSSILREWSKDFADIIPLQSPCN